MSHQYCRTCPIKGVSGPPKLGPAERLKSELSACYATFTATSIILQQDFQPHRPAVGLWLRKEIPDAGGDDFSFVSNPPAFHDL